MLLTQIDTDCEKYLSKYASSKEDAFYKTRDKARDRARDNVRDRARDNARDRAHVLTCVSCSGVRGGSGGCISPVPYKAP